MSKREIEKVVYLGHAEVFEETNKKKHMVFLLLLRPTYAQK